MAIVSIFWRSVASALYSIRNSLGSSAAATIASASSMAPFPPSTKWVQTAVRTPTEAAISRMACVLGREVLRKRIDGDDRGDAVAAHDLNVLEQVGGTLAHFLGVLRQHFGRERSTGRHLVPSRVQFERPHGGHDDGSVRGQPRRAALDVEEPLGSHVRPESGLGDQVLAAMNPDEVGDDRRVAVGDIAEWAGVDQDRACSQASAAGWALWRRA